MSRTLEIGIIGGSIGGLFAAGLLARDGHHVTVLERSRTGLSRRGGGLVAQQELTTLLRKIGHDAASLIGVEANERIVLNRAGTVVDRDPTPQTQLSWDAVYELFRGLIPARDYRLDTPVRAVVTAKDHSIAQLENGEELRFDLVIGADGVHSVTRDTVAPGDSHGSYVGYVTWRGLVPELALPPSAGAVLFESMALYTGPGEHAVGCLVPGAAGETDPGHRRYSWVWYRNLPDAGLAELMVRAGKPSFSSSISPREVAPVIRTQLVNAAVRCLPEPLALAVAVEPQPFMRAVFDYVAPRMSRGRVALLGDAAVTIRPHAAMGAAKAAGDAMTLVDLIARLPLDAALVEYDRLRLPIGRRIAEYSRRLGDSLPLRHEVA